MEGRNVTVLCIALGVVVAILQGCGGGADTTTTTIAPTTTVAIATTTTESAGTSTTTAQEQTTSTTPVVTTTTKAAASEFGHCLTHNADACTSCEPEFTLSNGECLYACTSNDILPQGSHKELEHKGMCVDDTTFQNCADEIPSKWPNTNEKMGSVRLFSASMVYKDLPAENRTRAWRGIKSYLKGNAAKAFVGTQISCNETQDDMDWAQVLELLKLLGSEHVMAVAIGNEMELLYTKDYVRESPGCIERIWKGGYFWKKTQDRVKDLDALGADFAKIPVTSVFGAAALGGNPFYETPFAMVKTYLTDAYKTYGSRWVWVLNIYPYFDPNLGSQPCDKALEKATCWDNDSCLMIATAKDFRRKIKVVTHKDDDTMWIGENGWSFPKSDTLNGAMANCPEFSSKEAFRTNYERFLSWDMTLPQGLTPKENGPDHIFYFTMRDSVNFGVGEHFGVINTCNEQQCKLQKGGGVDDPAHSEGTTTTAQAGGGDVPAQEGGKCPGWVGTTDAGKCAPSHVGACYDPGNEHSPVSCLPQESFASYHCTPPTSKCSFQSAVMDVFA